ncbi:MAG: T9SS type A sorting domain-containing protein [Saprospiraceae bacterium]|nr:T9SS type A sorting domain-containing protein [Saprospiraceae bacterium]
MDLLIIGAIVLILLVFSFRTIDQGTIGVVTIFGRYQRILTPGLNFIIPIIESIHKRISVQNRSAELAGGLSYIYYLYDIQFTSDAGYLAGGSRDDNDGNYDPDYYVLKTTKDPECAGSANKCQNITPIFCGQTYNGSTLGRLSNFKISDLNSCYQSNSPFDAGDQLFEVYKPNNVGDLVVTLFCDNLDLDIFLLSSCNPVECLAYSTQPAGSKYNQDVIRINNASAGYYYILVDGSLKSDEGAFQLTVNCGLMDCTNATPIQCKQKLINESNANGFNNISLYCNPSQIGSGTGCTGKERVYTFTLNSVQNTTISLTNIRDPKNDFEMYLFKDCNEDNCLAKSTNPPDVDEIITTSLNPGSYYIVIDGWRESQGNYDISVDWNCCSNPVELYNCGYISYKYAGSGNDLRFTFTSSKTIANGKKWKVGNTEVTTATGTSFTYTFPSAGEYTICFPYLNANNCLEYCCYKVWISNPFDCFLFDYRFNPTSNNYTFNLDIPGATNIVWKDDTGGGTIGGGPISNPVPAPPGGGCVEKTITVTYYLNGRWYICCRKIWICNPFDCLEFDYRFDLNSNGMVFQLNNASASNITWKDDTGGNGGGDIGGGPISNPVPVPPNPGDCIERIISVKYFANGRWYLCCRRVWICNPFECLQFDYKYDASSNGFVFNLDDPGASNISWIDDTGGNGGGIGSGSKSNPIPVPPSGGCVEKVITAKYFYNNRWYVCCRRVWLCNPFECANITFQYNASAGGYIFQLTQPGASYTTWKDDTGGGDIGGGPMSNPVPPPSTGPCIEKIITARYFYNGRWYLCCKRFWLCDPRICSGKITSIVQPTGQVMLSVSNSYSNVVWIDQKTGNVLGTGPSIQTNFSYGSNQEICVQYNDQGITYMCCKNILVVGSIDIASPNHSIQVYPNPAKELINILIKCPGQENFKVSLINLYGSEIQTTHIYAIDQKEIKFVTTDLVPGVYYIQVTSAHYQSVSKIEILH